MLPAYAMTSIGFGVGLALLRAHVQARSDRRWHLAELAVLLLAVGQMAWLVYDPMVHVPTDADRRSGDELVARLAEEPGDVFVPFHPYLTRRAGKPQHLHGAAIVSVWQARGVEGWVDVRFDVMTNGLVTNIVVTRSSHKAFEKAAIKAAQRFRFKAPVVDGVPQVATGIDYRFRFEMND